MKEREIIKYAIEAYSFIIPFNVTITFKEFSGLIKSCFDCESNSRNKMIAEVINSHSGEITRSGNSYKATWEK